jgi:hypothetical protein
MAAAIETRCLFQVDFTRTGGQLLLQNWQKAPLVYRGRTYQYVPIATPTIQKRLGPDNSSIRLLLPNVGNDKTGAIALREIAQNGNLADARVLITIFPQPSASAFLIIQRWVVKERVFAAGEQDGAWIEVSLRPADDAQAKTMTIAYTDRNIYQSPRAS